MRPPRPRLALGCALLALGALAGAEVAAAQAPVAFRLARAADPTGDAAGPPGSDLTSFVATYEPPSGVLRLDGTLADVLPVDGSVQVVGQYGTTAADGSCSPEGAPVVRFTGGSEDSVWKVPPNSTYTETGAPPTDAFSSAVFEDPEAAGGAWDCVSVRTVRTADGQQLDQVGPVALPPFDRTAPDPAPPTTTDAVPPPAAPAPVAPVAPTAPVAPKLTLAGSAHPRLGALRYTITSDRPATVRVTAQLGGVRTSSEVTLPRAGARRFAVRTSAAQRRRLRRALARGPVRVRVVATADGARATAGGRLRR